MSEYIAKCAAASAASAAAAIEGLRPAGLLVERRAKQIVVEKDIIDTGNLLGNITTGEPVGNHIDITSEADYSIYNEFGKSGQPARPYMRPATSEMKPQIEKLIGAMFISAVFGAMRGGKMRFRSVKR
jgi:HK97 gp10 family phage protein